MAYSEVPERREGESLEQWYARNGWTWPPFGAAPDVEGIRMENAALAGTLTGVRDEYVALRVAAQAAYDLVKFQSDPRSFEIAAMLQPALDRAPFEPDEAMVERAAQAMVNYCNSVDADKADDSSFWKAKARAALKAAFSAE